MSEAPLSTVNVTFSHEMPVDPMGARSGGFVRSPPSGHSKPPYFNCGGVHSQSGLHLNPNSPSFAVHFLHTRFDGSGRRGPVAGGGGARSGCRCSNSGTFGETSLPLLWGTGMASKFSQMGPFQRHRIGIIISRESADFLESAQFRANFRTGARFAGIESA